ncbi:MAG: GTP cyclohydrolase IIa [Thermoproteota archaeon]
MPLLIGLIELLGYREWTESLGPDREWLIQKTQSKLYEVAVDSVSRYGGFVVDLTGDSMIAILNGMTREALEAVYRDVAAISPTLVSMRVCSSRTCWKAGRSVSPGLHVEDFVQGPVAAIHIDMNNLTEARSRLGIMGAAVEVFRTLSNLYMVLLPRGIPVGYLGGDNLVVFSGYEDLDHVIQLLRSSMKLGEMYKAGVGVGYTAREALMYAAKALHELREDRDKALRNPVKVLVSPSVERLEDP